MRVLVVANDAGGAEMLAALVTEERAAHTWTLACRPEAPARRVFERWGLSPEVHPYTDARTGLPASQDLALCNVGWRDVKDGVVEAVQRVAPLTVGVLDSWVNYRERFGYPGPQWRDHLPAWMAACDSRAYELAGAFEFPRVVRLRHYLLAAQRNRWRAMGAPPPGRDLLFLSQIVQPRTDGALVGTPYQRYETPEREALAQLLEHWPDMAARFGCDRLVVRRHPSAPAGLYEQELGPSPGGAWALAPPGTDVLDSLASARFVVGMTSAALVTAMVIGRPAYSLAPEGADAPLPLPPDHYVDSVAGLLDRVPGAPVRDSQLDLFEEERLDRMLQHLQGTLS